MGVDDGNIQVTDGCRNYMHNGKLSNINIPTCSGCGSTHEHNISLLRCIMLFKGADRIHSTSFCCMFLELFLFAKKMKFLTKGGIHCISRSSLGTFISCAGTHWSN